MDMLSKVSLDILLNIQKSKYSCKLVYNKMIRFLTEKFYFQIKYGILTIVTNSILLLINICDKVGKGPYQDEKSN